MDCNDPIYQGYHAPLTECVTAGTALPHTGLAVAIFVVVGLLVLAMGVALRSTYGRSA